MGLVCLVFVFVAIFDSTAAGGKRSYEAIVAGDNTGSGTGTSGTSSSPRGRRG